MVCQVCGSPVEGAFCSHCGARVAVPPAAAYVPPPPGYVPPPAYGPGYGPPPPAMYAPPRVAGHVQTLGILWCIYGAYRAAVGIFGALVLMGFTAHGWLGSFFPMRGYPFMPLVPFMSGLAAFVAVFTLISSALAFATGFSLLSRKPWGRTLAIVAAILSLIKIPIGTGLGIYTLWVMMPATSAAEYDAMADRSR